MAQIQQAGEDGKNAGKQTGEKQLVQQNQTEEEKMEKNEAPHTEEKVNGQPLLKSQEEKPSREKRIPSCQTEGRSEAGLGEGKLVVNCNTQEDMEDRGRHFAGCT